MVDMMDAVVAGDPAAVDALVHGRHGDPFALLGPHETASGPVIRVLAPGARGVEILAREDGSPIGTLDLAHGAGLFAGRMLRAVPYRLRIQWPAVVEETEDPYAFGPLLGELDLYLTAEGKHREMGRCLGAQSVVVEGIPGIRFAVWAPNAARVSVVGDFNAWDGRRHAMRRRVEAGIWEIFLPRLQPGARYKYEILGADGAMVPLKADPVALRTELPPATASVIADPTPFRWTDQDWMERRAERHAASAPLGIYEVHAVSWFRGASDAMEGWDDLAARLIPYAADMGFTHIELLPITEHPFTGSWGYQPLAMFAPTARLGSPRAFARFVDRCHAAGLGLIVDWVPAHFPDDPHGLSRFDGTPLYEHQDPREGFHRDWNTLIYNFGRNEVSGFLIASALEWLERFHVDGLRVDAVASMLYRDYSRTPGEWVPNIHGGRENLEAVAFLRHLSTVVAERCPGAIVIAEESTAWPGVTAPVDAGGLGFAYKWNMGWMHDTLRYMQQDPIHRRYHHDDLTFGLIYAYSERFILPLSHDEVVHGKGSLIGRMPGDRWQRFANLRAYFGFMWTHPGKKLLFMGGEFAQEREWNHDAGLDWGSLDDPLHRGVQALVRDLNRLYVAEPALHVEDARPEGFQWLVGDDRQNSVFAYLRRGGEAPPMIAVANMTPVPRHGYRIGVPAGGFWAEVLNSDAEAYGGSGVGNNGGVTAEEVPSHGHPGSVMLTLPPLATIVLKHGG
jgi:1,4-alpha-glucan branching enzyme